MPTTIDLRAGRSFDKRSGEGSAPERSSKGAAGSLLSLRQAQLRYPVDLRWSVGATRIKLTGHVDDPSSLSGLDGVLEMEGADLAKLYPLIGIPIPPSPPYRIKGRVTYAGRVVRFENFAGTLGGSDLSGTLRVDTGGAKPRLDGELSSRTIVFADLAGWVGGDPGKPDAPNATPERKAAAAAAKASAKSLPTATVDFAKLNAIEAHVTYRGRHLEADYLPIDDLSARLDLVDGRLSLRPLTFGVGSGRIALNLDLDSRVKPARVTTEAEFRDLDLRRIMAQTRMFDGVGTIRGRATVAGTGNSVAEVMAAGDGDLTLVMSDGQVSALALEIAGLEVADALGVAATDRGKQVPIRCLVADGELRKGVLAARTLVFDTTDTTIAGAGSVDFGDESLKFRLQSHPKSPSILTLRTPIDVRGTLKDPTVAPDAGIAGGRGAAMVGLGIVLTPLGALIPTIDLGLGEDSDCAGLIAAAGGAGVAGAAGAPAAVSPRHR